MNHITWRQEMQLVQSGSTNSAQKLNMPFCWAEHLPWQDLVRYVIGVTCPFTLLTPHPFSWYLLHSYKNVLHGDNLCIICPSLWLISLYWTEAVVLCQLDSMKPCIAVKDISFRQLKWWTVDMDTLRANLMRSELCTNVFPSLEMMVSSGLSLIFQVAVKKDTSRRGVKQLGVLFGAIFLLFSY